MSAALIAIEKRMEFLRTYSAHARGEPSDVILVRPEKSTQVVEALARAEDIYVAPDIVRLLQSQQHTLPTTIPFHETDLPMPTGFVWLGEPWELPIGSPVPGDRTFVDGFAWSPAEINYVPIDRTAAVTYSAVNLSLFGRVERPSMGQPDRTGWLWDSFWRYGTPLDDEVGAKEVEIEREDGEISSLIDTRPGNEEEMTLVVPDGTGGVVEGFELTLREARTLMYLRTLAIRVMAYSVWHFMSQRVVSRERVHPDRAMRRRFEGYWRDLPEPPSVEVIRLRRALRPQRQASADERHHEVLVRHVVAGHWHTYWVGPKHSRYVDRDGSGARQPVLLWLDPFIRGPGDMPLKASHKLFHVSR